jgi:hypothetical protein
VENPLTKLIPVEEREDGVYIKIHREDRDKVHFEDIIKALDGAPVLNYDATRISDIYTRARGLFEKIGPPFEYYDEGCEQHIQLTVTQDRATLLLPAAAGSAGLKLTVNRLHYFLTKRGVLHGIKNEALAALCVAPVYNTPVEVAASTPPVKGENASVEFLVAVSPDTRPLIREDGKVDYREIKSFTSVAAKQVIARKKPATAGIMGTAVTGIPIPSVPGSDIPLPAGRNTEVSKDGSTLIASKTGIIFRDGGSVNVIELLDISGNVDFSVGNIKYSGDVLVHGNVLPGFVIEAEGTVHIKGEVESARIISRNGFVQVEHGIIGKGDTFISAKKGISLLFAQETTLATEGQVTIDKYLLNCQCTCYSLQSKDHHGSLIGGQTSAEKSVEVGHLGAENGQKTKIALFDHEARVLSQKLAELCALEKKLIAELEPIDKQLRTKSALLKKFKDEATSRQLAEVKKWIDAYNALTTKIKYVHQKMDELRAMIDRTETKEHDGYIKVSGSVFHGTEMDLYGRFFVVSGIMNNLRFWLKKSEIQYGP